MNPFRRTTTEREARVVAFLAESPLGRKLEAEAEAEMAKARAALQAKKVAIAEEHQKSRPPLVAEMAKAQEGVDAATAALRDAQAVYAQAHGALRSHDYSFERATSLVDGELRESAPTEVISAFKRELSDLLDQLRNHTWETVVGPKFINGASKWVVTNRDSWQVRYDAIGEAIRAADGLATDPHVVDFEAAIEAIRATVPEVEAVELSKKQQREIEGRDESDDDEPSVSIYERRGAVSA